MKNMNPYLSFAGNCEDALNFYKHIFGGEILSIMHFGDAPMEIPEDQKQQIMHSEFKAEGVHFMAADTMLEQQINIGTNISLSLDMTDENEQTSVFENLAAGGTVRMALEDTFWGARFGMLTDKFGVHWLLNYDKAK